ASSANTTLFQCVNMFGCFSCPGRGFSAHDSAPWRTAVLHGALSCARSACSDDHPRPDRGVGPFVDEYEPAGLPVLGVLVHEHWLGGTQTYSTDLVEGQVIGLLVTVQRIDVQPVPQVLDHDPRGACGVFDEELGTRGELASIGHPAHHRLDVLRCHGGVVRTADHVTT